MTLGGDEGLRKLQYKQIWSNIIHKYEIHKDPNEFLNSLTEDEFIEYAKDGEGGRFDILETGRESHEAVLGAHERRF